ncbi:MAG TPA: hypothetical protein PKJ83_17230 [Cyclobacteriaceae bacterium]|nr:hypothetical protein [Cyclobacteriaceae bacterium]HPW62901.1 hypothetical protein [Cyclobacteriaceae bacterium]
MSDKVKIESGAFEVYDTGTVISANNQPIDFFFSGLTFRFVFKNDIAKPPMNVHAQQFGTSGNGLEITFVNYENSLGAGNKEPLKIGHIGGRELFLNYRIYSLQPGFDKLVHYTWYLAKK